MLLSWIALQKCVPQYGQLGREINYLLKYEVDTTAEEPNEAGRPYKEPTVRSLESPKSRNLKQAAQGKAETALEKDAFPVFLDFSHRSSKPVCAHVRCTHHMKHWL